MTMSDRGNCAVCGKDTALTKNKLVRGHGDCPGGGSAPDDKDDASRIPAQPNPHRAPLPPDSRLGGSNPYAKKEEPVTEDVFQAVETTWPVERDSFDRYKLPHPVTGKVRSWQRATTLVGMCENTFNVDAWQKRCLLHGLTHRPDLLESAYGLDVKVDSKRLNEIAGKAMDAGGSNVASNLGTAFHTATETVDGGGSLNEISPRFKAGVQAYQAELSAYGVVIIPEMIERRVILADLGVAGQLDRIVLVPADSPAGRYLGLTQDTYMIADIKSGSSVELGDGKIAAQLALYAHAVNESGVYRPTGFCQGVWEKDITVSETIALVMHVPQGNGACRLNDVDLIEGWATVEECLRVRDRRKIRGVVQPMSLEPGAVSRLAGREPEPVSRPSLHLVSPPGNPEPSPYLKLLSTEVGAVGSVSPPAEQASPPAEPTWEKRFAAVGSRAQAFELYQKAKAQGLTQDRLTQLVALGKARLIELGV